MGKGDKTRKMRQKASQARKKARDARQQAGAQKSTKKSR